MATTKTYLCYGIPVTNESLTYATLAYQRLEGPFRFIRLVQKRRREGTLQTSPTSAVGSLPVELWDVVRYKLTDLELSDTKRKFMIDHACGDCSEEASEEDPRISYWNNLVTCPWCEEQMNKYKGFEDHSMARLCRRLLNDYGLDLPSVRVLQTTPEDWPQFPAGHPSAVAFIALSPSPYLPPDRINANDHASFIEPEVDEDRFRNDGIWPLSFNKPANADLRFRHLLRDLHLSPLKVSDGKIGIARARRSKRTRTYEEFKDNEEVRPKWYLFTTVEHVEPLLRTTKASAGNQIGADPSTNLASTPKPPLAMASKTYFCYGLPVTNESLTYATMAYEQVDGPLRFIRLVQKRVREGTLQASPASAVGSLPIELWDLVRHEVIDLELCAAERKFLDTHACPHCVSPDGCPNCGAPGAEKWKDLLRCIECREVLSYYTGLDDVALTKQCRALLHDYGLDMPSTRTLKSSQSQDWQLVEGDPDSVAFVAVSPSSPPDSADAEDHVSYEEPGVDEVEFFRNDGIWPISFKKPADAVQRFRRLLRDWHLTPLKVGDGTIGIARDTDPDRKRTYKRIDADKVKPRWHLFTTVECEL